MIRPLKILAVFLAASSFASLSHAGRLSLSIEQPRKDAILFTTQPIEISGTAKPAARISSVTVRVAGQTLRPVGTNRWAVNVTIPKAGRYEIKVTAKTDTGRKITRKRVIRVFFPIR